MSSGNKHFLALSRRQKQRRLTRIRLRGYSERTIENETESSSDGASHSGNCNEALERNISEHNSSESENEETIPENGRHHDDDGHAVDENIENADMQEPISDNDNERNDQMDNAFDDVIQDHDNNEQDLTALQRNALRNAFLSVNVNHTQAKKILATLRSFPFNIANLPKDPRTLFKTPKAVVKNMIQNMSGGKYLHIGCKVMLQKILLHIPDQILPEFVLLDLSTVGGSVHNSGRKTFWPIQLRPLNILNKKPFIAGVFLRNTKPTNVFEFFQPFLQEIREIAEEGGIEVRGRRFPLRFRIFIADAPARAFCLNQFSHDSYFPCSKCWIEARPCENPRFSRSRALSGVDHRPRTDE